MGASRPHRRLRRCVRRTVGSHQHPLPPNKKAPRGALCLAERVGWALRARTGGFAAACVERWVLINTLCHPTKSPLRGSLFGGEGGIRTHEGLQTLAGFQDQCIQPLCHLSFEVPAVRRRILAAGRGLFNTRQPAARAGWVGPAGAAVERWSLAVVRLTSAVARFAGGGEHEIHQNQYNTFATSGMLSGNGRCPGRVCAIG